MVIAAERPWESGRAAVLCPAATRTTIDGFTRYSGAVPASQRRKVSALAAAIRASHRRGCDPVLVVELQGHADRDPAREAREPGFEVRMSLNRARTVERALRAAVGRHLAGRISWRSTGIGSSRLVVAAPRNEADRQRNRRVEASFTPSPRGGRLSPPPTPFCGGPPPTPVPSALSAILTAVAGVLSKIPPPLRAGIVPPTTLRFLFLHEQVLAARVFGSSLDLTRIFISDGLGLSGRPFTIAVPTARGSVIVMLVGRRASSCMIRGGDAALLIHELTHAWQSQHHQNSTEFMVNSVKSQLGAIADLPVAKAAAATRATSAAVASGVIDPRRLASIGAAAAAAEDTSAYAYRPGGPFGAYAAEQIAQQVEDDFTGLRANPSITSVVRGAVAGAVVPDNVTSLASPGHERKGAPGVVFH